MSKIKDNLDYFLHGFPKDTLMVPVSVKAGRKSSQTRKTVQANTRRKRTPRKTVEEQIHQSCLIIEANGTPVGGAVNGWHDPFGNTEGLTFASDGWPVHR